MCGGERLYILGLILKKHNISVLESQSGRFEGKNEDIHAGKETSSMLRAELFPVFTQKLPHCP